MVALDLGMPGMDGVELLRFLADAGFRAPVLIVSGFDRRVLEAPSGSARRSASTWSARSKSRPGSRARRPAQPIEGRRWCHDRAGRARAARRLRAGADQRPAAHGLSAQGLAADGAQAGRGAGPLGRSRARRRSPPSRFVPLAEKHGLIDELTQWGLRTTLRQWLDWREQGIDTCIAFNISALSLEQLDFPDLVERMCRALGVPTDRLVLELTEGATQPLVKLMDTLTRFRIKGIGLAIDDFGTGYSSLMQLRQLPFTEVKIDRFFVADATTLARQRLIVSRIIDLAHGLGLTATAEGVETDRAAAPAARARLRRRPGLSDLPAARAGARSSPGSRKFRRAGRR
jgi:EAL domain-containing protein (putative c-di-GMP-specific phosphodiesterase class I)